MSALLRVKGWINTFLQGAFVQNRIQLTRPLLDAFTFHVRNNKMFLFSTLIVYFLGKYFQFCFTIKQKKKIYTRKAAMKLATFEHFKMEMFCVHDTRPRCSYEYTLAILKKCLAILKHLNTHITLCQINLSLVKIYFHTNMHTFLRVMVCFCL